MMWMGKSNLNGLVRLLRYRGRFSLSYRFASAFLKIGTDGNSSANNGYFIKFDRKRFPLNLDKISRCVVYLLFFGLGVGEIAL
jgi:hypothetical protein